MRPTGTTSFFAVVANGGNYPNIFPRESNTALTMEFPINVRYVRPMRLSQFKIARKYASSIYCDSSISHRWKISVCARCLSRPQLHSYERFACIFLLPMRVVSSELKQTIDWIRVGITRRDRILSRSSARVLLCMVVRPDCTCLSHIWQKLTVCFCTKLLKKMNPKATKRR